MRIDLKRILYRINERMYRPKRSGSGRADLKRADGDWGGKYSNCRFMFRDIIERSGIRHGHVHVQGNGNGHGHENGHIHWRRNGHGY